MEKQIMWAVYGPDGKINMWTLSVSEDGAKAKELANSGKNWGSYEKAGYYCVQVSVTIEPIKPNQ